LLEVLGASATKQQRSKRLGDSTADATRAYSLAVELVQPPPDTTLYERVVLMAACN
jgi:hypothetical protein